MGTQRIVLTSGFLVLIIVVTSVCGALGLITNQEPGWPGATAGAITGALTALAVILVHGIRLAFSRTPEATAPTHHPESLEWHRLREAASAAFADILIVLALVTVGSFSVLRTIDMRIILVALLLTAIGDCAIRLLALRRKGF